MNICIDVGNSTIGLGAFKDNKLVERMVVNTDPHFTEDEFLSHSIFTGATIA